VRHDEMGGMLGRPAGFLANAPGATPVHSKRCEIHYCASRQSRETTSRRPLLIAEVAIRGRLLVSGGAVHRQRFVSDADDRGFDYHSMLPLDQFAPGRRRVPHR